MVPLLVPANALSGASQNNSSLVLDLANKATYAPREAALTANTISRFSPVEIYEKFEWYVWNFTIDTSIDAVGDFDDGIGTFYYRLFTPETKRGEKYPVLMCLGGLGATNSFASNGYARYGAYYASQAVQSQYPCYVLTFNIPYEACVNYEAELAYVYQMGEVVKALEKEFGNIDMDRIYSTGRSQGAGWSYELASVQPDLLAAIMLDAGTTVHTTWGNQCDMNAIAESDVNVYILHGYNDQYIPVNEAYRAYNTLVGLGKKNINLQITDDRHGIENIPMWSNKEVTPLMKWLLTQKKGVNCVDQPVLIEDGSYVNYRWAGVWALSHIEGWATAHEYASWVEPVKNDTWNKLKDTVARNYVSGRGGIGNWHLARIRIGDELQTTYDGKMVAGLLSTESDMEQAIVVNPGDVLAVTIQGYTGAYGDGWEAFNRDWSVDWAILKGDVTNIRLTHRASPVAIVRPATVALANGAGPNINNSLYSWNAIDGRQVYFRVDIAEHFRGEDLEIAFRFTRDLGGGESASYWHIVRCKVL
jgi:predicted peptidase